MDAGRVRLVSKLASRKLLIVLTELRLPAPETEDSEEQRGTYFTNANGLYSTLIFHRFLLGYN